MLREGPGPATAAAMEEGGVLRSRISHALSRLHSATDHHSDTAFTLPHLSAPSWMDAPISPPHAQQQHHKQQEEYMERLSTYKSMWWFAKPSNASASMCSRYGWVNTDQDELTCTCCGAKVVWNFGLSPDPNLVEKWVQEFLQGGHKELCMWYNYSLPKEFEELPAFSRGLLAQIHRTGLSEGVLALVQHHDPDAFEGFHSAIKHQCVKLLDAQDVSRALQMAHMTNPVQELSFLLAAFGWVARFFEERHSSSRSVVHSEAGNTISTPVEEDGADGLRFVLECSESGNEIPMWSVSGLLRASFDPLASHKVYSPWIAMDGAGVPMWQSNWVRVVKELEKGCEKEGEDQGRQIQQKEAAGDSSGDTSTDLDPGSEERQVMNLVREKYKRMHQLLGRVNLSHREWLHQEWKDRGRPSDSLSSNSPGKPREGGGQPGASSAETGAAVVESPSREGVQKESANKRQHPPQKTVVDVSATGAATETPGSGPARRLTRPSPQTVEGEPRKRTVSLRSVVTPSSDDRQAGEPVAPENASTDGSASETVPVKRRKISTIPVSGGQGGGNGGGGGNPTHPVDRRPANSAVAAAASAPAGGRGKRIVHLGGRGSATSVTNSATLTSPQPVSSGPPRMTPRGGSTRGGGGIPRGGTPSRGRFVRGRGGVRGRQ